ncbi:choline/carnitine O-acyltransferase [Sporosarcina sp. GW1-11]|uniref:choline/carnitine O-acyltransferase n=1 Tax=Sporosarcina sp. GW1-11 TaxID=2899126 RepID=UPI00294E9110|nr:choline/carnitine O-acyltransferase [Sporosarcina sp. GW1-11]MDV6378164.1 choline/carnitine O-acyltransferase [Sporosarcina sp. GW1-11]
MTKTFSNQSALPQLPIPELNDTMNKLLAAIKPLVSDTQFRETTRAVKVFSEDSGDAQKLQEKLMEWNQHMKGSWLKPFWDNLYLQARAPLHTSSNFNIIVDNQDFKNHYSVAKLAGKVSRSVAELYQAIISEEIEPEMVRNIPLDMSQYPNFFRSIRIPKLGRDEHYVAKLTNGPLHICLLYKGNIYKLPVSDDNNIMLTSEALSNTIESMFLAEDTTGQNIGILTTAERNHAAEICEQLLNSKVHEENLQCIADSLVVISIDEESKTPKEALKNLFVSGKNKWFDKTFQIVITKTGEIGYSMEHTAIDGTTSFAVIQYITEQLVKNEPETIRITEKPIIKKLQWELSDELKEELMKLENINKLTVADYYLDIRNFDTFGTDEMKRLKFSPDSFFHMALQVAQYRTFGHMRSTYEAVSMRSFNEGRTECLRPSNAENLALAKAMEEEERDLNYLYGLMQQASAAHSINMREAQKGFGVERHVYGLEKIFELYKEELEIGEMPKLFTDPGYALLRHDYISTSNMSSPLVKSCIFGPVVEDGYGIFYTLLNDRVGVNLSSYKRNEASARLLSDHLFQALEELREIALQEM